MITTVLVALLLSSAGCSVRTSPTGVQAAPPARTAPSRTSATPASSAGVDKVLVIMEENRSIADVSKHMPYLTSQGQTYGTATNYFAETHPSLPNYLGIAGGSTFDVRNDKDPADHRLTGPSVFGRLVASGHTAKTYAEAMPGNCKLRNDTTYAVRHNPWTYFVDPDERAACRKYDVPAGTPQAGALHDDIAHATLPNLSLVIPDVCNDGHDCSAATADTWLREWLPAIKAGQDFQSGRLAVVVTWDEDDDHSRNQVSTTVIHPTLHHRTVDSRLDHYALSASILRLAGLPPLRKAARASDLLAAFSLR